MQRYKKQSLGWHARISLCAIFLFLAGCAGRTDASRMFSMPPPPTGGTPSLQKIHDVMTTAGFVLKPADKNGYCGFFEDMETVAYYEYAANSNITLTVRQTVTQPYCAASSHGASYHWFSGYDDQGKWVTAYGLPRDKSWKPGDPIFRRGILLLYFDEWQVFGKQSTSNAAALRTQLRQALIQALGADSLHDFPAETRKKGSMYLLP